MSRRFLLDEDLSRRVAEGLRARGIDAVAVSEVHRGNRAIPDEDQLRYATEHARVLVTYNRADFQALDVQWRRKGQRHAGILWCSERIIPRRAFGDLIRALEAVTTDEINLTGLCLPPRRPPPP